MKYQSLFTLCIITIMLSFSSCLIEGSKSSDHALFNTFKQTGDYWSFRLPAWTASAFIDGDEEPVLKSIVKQLDHVSILLHDGDERDACSEAKSFDKMLVENNYQEMLEVKDGDDLIKLKGLQVGDEMKDVVITISADDNFIALSLDGNVDLAAITKYIQSGDYNVKTYVDR